MLLRAKGELFDRHLVASDGRIGSVRDVYLDDAQWVVRYLEVEADELGLGGRKVLISPSSIRRDAGNDQEVVVTLTREQVRNSPGADQDMPVSRQFEEAHARHYGYPFYWAGPYLWGVSPQPISGEPSVTLDPLGEAAGERVRELKEAEQRARESHLRSSEEVIGYRLIATDGPAGHVEDFVIDDSDWRITDIVIDTRNWLPGAHLRLPTSAVTKVDWATREVRLKIPRAEVEKAPKA